MPVVSVTVAMLLTLLREKSQELHPLVHESLYNFARHSVLVEVCEQGQPVPPGGSTEGTAAEHSSAARKNTSV